MVKPKTIPFTEALESVLVSIWGCTKDYLDTSHIKKTRNAIVDIRTIYRFKGENNLHEYPSTIRYQHAKNRAGYLAAFGQRHAYLTYAHLKKIEEINPEVIPQPSDNKGEVIVTTLGAGTAIEVFGICLFYNQEAQRLRKIRINLIEKVDAWVPNRHTLFDKLLKGTFRKLDIIPNDINADLTKDCIRVFSDNYDSLVKTDILLIYNVMNEITTKHNRQVWRNIRFLLNNNEKPLLILLAEPSAPNASPRISWLKIQLAQCTDFLTTKDEEEFILNSEPIKIAFENTSSGLNHRLFRHTVDGVKPPKLMTSIIRTHLACIMKPNSPISMEQVIQQLATLKVRRNKKGYFVGPITKKSQQLTLWEKDTNLKPS